MWANASTTGEWYGGFFGSSQNLLEVYKNYFSENLWISITQK